MKLLTKISLMIILITIVMCKKQNATESLIPQDAKTELVQNKVGWTKYSHLAAFDIEIDNEQNMWTATRTGIYKWNLNDGSYYRVSPDDSTYTCITHAPDGTWWFASRLDKSKLGVVHFDGTTWKRYTTSDGFPSNRIFDIVIGADNKVWFCTADAGVVSFDGKNWKTYTTSDGLATNKLGFSFAAKDGTVWLGSIDDQGGVSCLKNNQWKTYKTSNGLLKNATVSFGATGDGLIWFGTMTIGGGVSSFDGNTWKHFTMKDGLVAGNIESFALSPKGSLWFGSYNFGLSCYEGNQWKKYAYSPDNGLPVKNVYAMAFSSDGVLWVSAADGMARYKEAK